MFKRNMKGTPPNTTPGPVQYLYWSRMLTRLQFPLPWHGTDTPTPNRLTFQYELVTWTPVLPLASCDSSHCLRRTFPLQFQSHHYCLLGFKATSLRFKVGANHNTPTPQTSAGPCLSHDCRSSLCILCSRNHLDAPSKTITCICCLPGLHHRRLSNQICRAQPVTI